MTDSTAAIDVHAHALPDFLCAALQKAGRTASLGQLPAWSPEAHLDLMQARTIATSILSVSTPGVHFGDDHAAKDLARQFNEYSAALIQQHPTRFGAFAALPLPNIDAACTEARHALDTLHLDGIGLLASYDNIFLGDPKFDPLMAILNQRNALVFVHPAGHPSSRTLALEYPLWMIEYPIDTTRAALNLLMSGTLTRYPNIRFILAHNGGTLPYLTWRICAAPLIDRRYAHLDPDELRRGIASFHYEIAQSPGPEAFGSLLAIADPSRILYGTDWPYCRLDVIEHLDQTFDTGPGANPTLRHAIRRENPARVLGRSGWG
jgi:6-methylsalicylate decarboxylase